MHLHRIIKINISETYISVGICDREEAVLNLILQDVRVNPLLYTACGHSHRLYPILIPKLCNSIGRLYPAFVVFSAASPDIVHLLTIRIHAERDKYGYTNTPMPRPTVAAPVGSQSKFQVFRYFVAVFGDALVHIFMRKTFTMQPEPERLHECALVCSVLSTTEAQRTQRLN